MLNKSFIACFFTFLLSLSLLQSETKGKIEAGASYVHLDLIESNDTIKDIDMPAIRVEAAYSFGKGIYIKPFGMYGKKDESELTTAGASMGICMPLGDCFLVSPSVGFNYTHLITTIDLAFGDSFFVTLEETFKGWAPNIGLEVTYSLRKNLRISISGQYSWSTSDVDITDIPNFKSHSQGPAYAAMLEYDFSACWSINIAAAYNESYSKEKSGLRGRGIKIGLVRWF